LLKGLLMADFQLPDLEGKVASQKAARSGFNEAQAGQEADYLGRYTGAIQGQEGMGALSKRLGEELGLPTLQANAQKLQETIRNLPTTYGKATRGFDVNANQLARIIGTQTAKLSPAAEAAQNAASAATAQRNEQIGFAQADQAKELLPYQTEGTLLQNRLAREATGFSEDNGRELDAIISKMNAGITLSEGEKNRANALAVAEMNFNNQLKLNEQQAKLSGSGQPNTQVMETWGKKYLIDSGTGKIISTYGSGNATPVYKPSYTPNLNGNASQNGQSVWK